MTRSDPEALKTVLSDLEQRGLFSRVEEAGIRLTLFGPVSLPRVVGGREVELDWYTYVRAVPADAEPLDPGRESVSSVLVLGDPREREAPLVRVHSACSTGDVFGSLRCDCGPQLDAAFDAIGAEGAGVVIYEAEHEGRGIGLWHKAMAYFLQEDGLDTYAANQALGLPDDLRDYGEAAAVLHHLLGPSPRVRLLSNNPGKREALEQRGVEVAEVVPLVSGIGRRNAAYLEAKRRQGHQLPPLPPGHGA